LVGKGLYRALHKAFPELKFDLPGMW